LKKATKRANAENQKGLEKLLDFLSRFMPLRASGKTDAAKPFSEALETTPARGLRIRIAWGAHATNVSAPLTPEALSVY